MLFCALKARAMACRDMAVCNTEVGCQFSKEGDMLEQMAERVKWAGRVLREHCGSANEKGKCVAPSGCAWETRNRLMQRVWEERVERGDISREGNVGLSFLDADPEVLAVARAHDVLLDAGRVVERCACGLVGGLVVKHVARVEGCIFEIWCKHDAAREHGAGVDGGEGSGMQGAAGHVRHVP
jgi:hypothetical protein